MRIHSKEVPGRTAHDMSKRTMTSLLFLWASTWCKETRTAQQIVKRYPEPVAHGPEAWKPLHPYGRRQHHPSVGYPFSLIRGIRNPSPNH